MLRAIHYNKPMMTISQRFFTTNHHKTLLPHYPMKMISNNKYVLSSMYLTHRNLSSERLLTLNSISNLKDATRLRRRWGRGTGSGRGKQCGFGHQKSNAAPRSFEGGQTPLYKSLPKIGFHNFTGREMQEVNLDKIKEFILMKRLEPKVNSMLTMRDLLVSGIISQLKDGVKLLAGGKDDFDIPIHIEVSQASEEAIKAIERAGGTVTCTHFNALALRALLTPYKFTILPRRARPPPIKMNYYLDRTKCGYLSPEIQIRNLKLFGALTSEKELRREHEDFMKRKHLAYERLRAQKDLSEGGVISAGL